MTCWIAASVLEYDDARKIALSSGKTVHYRRVVPLCVETHCELPPDDRKYKGRVASDGSFVSDQNSKLAVFQKASVVRIIDVGIQSDRHHLVSAGLDYTAVGRAASLHSE